MSITKHTTVDEVTVDRYNNILVKIALEMKEDDKVLGLNWERTSIPPNGDISHIIGAVSTKLSGENWPSISPADLKRIEDVAASAWD